jgi:hypothetical protein
MNAYLTENPTHMHFMRRRDGFHFSSSIGETENTVFDQHDIARCTAGARLRERVPEILDFTSAMDTPLHVVP